MCGITAVFAYGADAPAVQRDEVERITAHMIPRGPDAGGTWYSADGRVGLGSRRLAIIDLSPDGIQPMTDVEGELTIVFNGEIYNYRQLRALLVARGVRFHSASDTEVLLQMYRLHGERMIELLRGMFAFTIWDSRSRRMFVARDPYGIKPLYFADDGRTFRAASTVKALLAGGAVSRGRDPGGAAGFLLFGSVPEPFTFFAGIRAMEAGTSFFVDENGHTSPRSHYSIAGIFRHADEQRTIADLTTPEIMLREQVSDSVAHHLVSDVPVGVFLSSGIDSTTIAALAVEQQHSSLSTVTILFDAFRGGEFDEADDAARFALELGTSHGTRVVTRDEFLRDLPRIFSAMDQPTIDGVNTWFVSKAAAERGLKVAISGVGGDELFGSYPSFRDVPRIAGAARIASRLPMGTRALAAGLGALEALGYGSPKSREIPRHGGSFPWAYLIKRGLFMPSELAAELGGETAEEGLRRLNLDASLDRMLDPDPIAPFSRVATLEATLYMRNQLLRDTDWASMAHSLEVRTPLVDASLLRQIAPLLVARGRECKQFFANAPARPLPPWVAQRSKTGFAAPLAEWLDLPPDGTSTRARSWARRVLEQYA